jgi:ribosomal 50S subunit-recycling heat shock protein
MRLHEYVAACIGERPATEAILNGRIRVNQRKRQQADSAVRPGDDLVEWLDGDLPTRLVFSGGAS